MPSAKNMRRHPGFIDFGLEVGCGAGSGYPLRVSSPAGDLQSTMQFPFAERALENRMLAIEDSLIRSGSKRDLAADLAPAAPQRTIQEFGEKLFQALLAGDARSLYDQSRREAEREGKGLRLKLRIDAPELASLPWEFLYDPRNETFVGLSSATPIVRDLGSPRRSTLFGSKRR